MAVIAEQRKVIFERWIIVYVQNEMIFCRFQENKASYYHKILLLFGGRYFFSTLFNKGRLLLFAFTAWRIYLTVEDTCLIGLFGFSYFFFAMLLQSLRWVELTLGMNILLYISSLFYSYSWMNLTYLSNC